MATYRILFCLALLALGMAGLMALLALVTWGEWTGRSLAVRLVSFASPVFVSGCIFAAKLRYDEGRAKLAIGLLLACIAPALAFTAFVGFIVERNS